MYITKHNGCRELDARKKEIQIDLYMNAMSVQNAPWR